MLTKLQEFANSYPFVIALTVIAAALGVFSMFSKGRFDENGMSPAGPRSVIISDIEAVDLFTQIARGDVCGHYFILTGIRTETDALKCRDKVAKEIAKIAQAPDQNRNLASARLSRAYTYFDYRGIPPEKLPELSTTRGPPKIAGEEQNAEKKPAVSQFELGQMHLRNQIQDEIFRASEQRCNAFKIYLQHMQSNTGFIGNSLALVLGGLGGLFQQAVTVRALSISAGTAAGVTAQFNDSYFFSLTVPVISDGIDNARSVVHKQATGRRNQGTDEYTLQGAILDAVRYDGACSIPEGLRAAGEAVKAVRNPGPDILEKAFSQYKTANNAWKEYETSKENPKPAAPTVSGNGPSPNGSTGSTGGQQNNNPTPGDF